MIMGWMMDEYSKIKRGHVPAVITGKPDPEFYRNAINSMACETATSIMIGDDVEADINGAIDVGMRAILVRTGKYRTGDENRISNSESLCVDSFNEAVDWILKNIN